jgi:hypothetical protein
MVRGYSHLAPEHRVDAVDCMERYSTNGTATPTDTRDVKSVRRLRIGLANY